MRTGYILGEAGQGQFPVKDAAVRHFQNLEKGREGPEGAAVCMEAPVSPTEERACRPRQAVDGAWRGGASSSPRHCQCGRAAPTAPLTFRDLTGIQPPCPQASLSWPVSPTELLTDTSKSQHLTFKKL